ncbi:MAG: family 16 glycosylhydrolase [Bacteroidota bacterium]
MKTFALLFLLLTVSAALSAKVYKGAEYRTKDTFLYGRFETRMKSSQRDGMLTSFFTYNDNYPTTPWNEIDIEILGRYTDDVQYNAITPGTTNHVGRRQIPFNPSQDFHIYAFEWTPAYVAWFIDGVESYRQTAAHIQTLTYAQKIMMNVWIQNSVNWSGQFNENSLPSFSYYDFVSYASYTPGTGSVGTGNNFTPQWKDDFNSFDAARWDKASHTFGDNLCDFIPENIVFKDGVMILCLTKEANIGFTDIGAPGVANARAEADGIMVNFFEEVDSLSAVTLNNYLVLGNTVTSAVLYSNKKTVRLTVASYDTTTLSTLILQNIKDKFVPPNTLGGRSIGITKPKRLTFPLKINCGGPAVNDFLQDQMWNANLEYGYLDGQQFQNTNTTSGSGDPAVFKSELNGTAEYRVRVPNGTYAVFLMMSENFFTAAGKRVFDVSVQGTVVEKDLDLFAKMGKSVQYQKVVPNVLVTEGLLDIHFMPSVDNAVINGITIMQLSTGVNGTNTTRPDTWHVGQNYPNPFNGSTVISFTLPEEQSISLQFFDMLGRVVNERELGMMQQGDHSFSWAAKDSEGNGLSSGAYLYVVRGKNFSSAKKMILVQ